MDLTGLKVMVIDDDRGVLVEPDVGTVLAADLLRGPDDHGLGHVALLHLPGRDRNSGPGTSQEICWQAGTCNQLPVHGG